jgi:hypothetical protein
MDAAARGPCQKASTSTIQMVGPLTEAHTQFLKTPDTSCLLYTFLPSLLLVMAFLVYGLCVTFKVIQTHNEYMYSTSCVVVCALFVRFHHTARPAETDGSYTVCRGTLCVFCNNRLYILSYTLGAKWHQNPSLTFEASTDLVDT